MLFLDKIKKMLIFVVVFVGHVPIREDNSAAETSNQRYTIFVLLVSCPDSYSTVLENSYKSLL